MICPERGNEFRESYSGWPKSVTRPLALVLATLACLALGGCGARPYRPNVVVILVDALRADLLGCYGHPAGLTPTMDALAEESLFFEQAYSNAPSTPRSVASLFTSTLPFVHRAAAQFWRQPVRARERMVLMPEILKAEGYHTAMVTTAGWITPEVNYDQGVDEYFVEWREDAHLVRRATEFLGERARQREKFFLYLHFLDLHDYYHAAKLFGSGREVPASVSEALRGLEGRAPSEIYRALRVEPERFSAADARFLLRSYEYEELLRETDRMIGQIVRELESLGLSDETLIILSSDHGEQFLEHRYLVHGGDSFYNEVLRIPLLFSAPGRFPERVTIRRPVSSIDVLPTLLALLSIERPEELQGREALEPGSTGEPVLATNERTWKLVSGRWSYIYSQRYDREELYDLNEDQAELVDLAAAEPERVYDLRAQRRQIIRNGREHVYLSENDEVGTVEMSDEVEKNLRSLGYLK